MRRKKSKVFLIKPSYQVGMQIAKICLLKKLKIKANPDNATDNILKYKASMISSALSLSNFKPFFKKERTVAVRKWDICKDISDCLI